MLLWCHIYFVFAIIVFANAAQLRFLTIGDWGDDTLEQRYVAETMDNFCSSMTCNFILALGDNFYENGVTSVDDPRFTTLWKDMYSGENIRNLTWYISLGNHDHTPTGNEQYQVEYGTVEPRWYLPWYWYNLDIPMDEDHNLQFTVVDSSSLIVGKYDPESQRAWFNETLAKSSATWNIVLAHHPAYSSGDYATYPEMVALLPTMQAAGVDLYLNGHDHNLQHITYQDPPFDLVISGAGGRGLYQYSAVNERFIESRGCTLQYFGYVHGFSVVTLDTDVMSMTVQHFTYDAVDTLQPLQLYTFTRYKNV